MSEEHKPDKDVWDKVASLSGVATGIFAPLILAFLGYLLNDALKRPENSVKYVELAVKIIQASPDEKDAAMREWAIDVLDHYSDVKLSGAAKAELKVRSIGWFTTGSGTATYRGGYENPSVDVVTTGCRAGERDCTAKQK